MITGLACRYHSNCVIYECPDTEKSLTFKGAVAQGIHVDNVYLNLFICYELFLIL